MTPKICVLVLESTAGALVEPDHLFDSPLAGRLDLEVRRLPAGKDKATHGAAAGKPTDEDAPLDGATSTDRRLRDAIAATTAPYLVIVEHGESLAVADVATAVAGLEDAPEAVLGSAALLWRAPAVALDVSTRDYRQANPHVHVGRRLARLLALRAVTFPDLSSVVLRRAALGSDLPATTPVDSDHPGDLRAALVLDLLVRGFAWSPTNRGYARRPAGATARDVASIGPAICRGLDLGLLNEADLALARANLAREASAAGVSPPSPRALPGERLPAPDEGDTSPLDPSVLLPAPTKAARPLPLRRFVIAAPDYQTGSAGPVALHMLCDRLNRHGYEATIAPIAPAPGIPGRGLTNPAWTTPVARQGDQLEPFVAVYPENVPGNPLGSPWVVRWQLHRPGHFGGPPMREGPDDLILAWADVIDPGRPVFSLPLTDLSIYYPKSTPGRGRLLWVGKGAVPPDLDRTGMTEITRSWPTGRRELATLLRSAEVVVSCDWLTALGEEAVLCGTPIALTGRQVWGSGEPMDVTRHSAPGIFACPDGAPTPEQLARATEECSQYQRDYHARVERIGASIDELVLLVNEHFERRAVLRQGGGATHPELAVRAERAPARAVR
ncbi:MAG: hypothetical protein M0T71_08935 [Actinomycetota bacterium]|nr:hypothetical protein [Actinomycetota bacterium]